MCYFVVINGKLIQSPDNDKVFGRIRSHNRRKGTVSLASWHKKAAAGREQPALCYQQGF
jgi:hypothetical protein